MPVPMVASTLRVRQATSAATSAAQGLGVARSMATSPPCTNSALAVNAAKLAGAKTKA